ncbi:ankyrin repeat-containing domain protein [Xylaria sp. FL0043]|nr:ankyrin repeat-containing domain protein [Xylaria sp. FL0043]
MSHNLRSLGLTWIARLKLYHQASETVWDAQERLFLGWNSHIRGQAQRKPGFIEHQETLLLNRFFNEMVFSDNPLAAFVGQTFSISPTPVQRSSLKHQITEAARAKANHFWENGDVSTALAMQEIALLHELEQNPRTRTSMFLKYSDIYLETTKRLTTVLGREVPALPPLHYILHLTKDTLPISPLDPIFSRFASAKDYWGRSSLHVALDLGMTRCADDLIGVGVTSTRDDWGRRPIHIACLQNSEALVKRVLEITVDCDVEDDLGRSALHYASSYGNESGVRLLLERGANIHHKDESHHSPISWAIIQGHTAVVQLLLEGGADGDSKYGGESFLTTAAALGHTSIVHALLDNGARPLNQPALFRAAGAGHTDTVILLLRYGASIDAEDFDGETALMYASRNGHANVVEVLLDNGAIINEENMYGDTALSYARRYEHVDVVELLLKRGADSTALSHA